MRITYPAALACLLLASCTSPPTANPCGPGSNCMVESNEDREQVVDVDDLKILDRAAALLKDPESWNRQDNRRCPADARTYSLFCALQAATIEVLGKYDHRRVALQEVRFAVEEKLNGREVEHRLMEFNNFPETTFIDIQSVITLARNRVAKRMRS